MIAHASFCTAGITFGSKLFPFRHNYIPFPPAAGMTPGSNLQKPLLEMTEFRWVRMTHSSIGQLRCVSVILTSLTGQNPIRHMHVCLNS